MSNPTAAIIIIGNEILSGRTLDVNTQEIAKTLVNNGISLIQTRVIADDQQMIIDTLRELSPKYDYIFTTGGIGPTHDDITAESIAKAFNIPYKRNEEVYKAIKQNYSNLGEELNEAREKMAYMPESSILIENNVTMVPGFAIRNLFVFAGIPNIMKAMLKASLPLLRKGKKVHSKSIDALIAESKIAVQFEALQKKYPNVEMGSYPFKKGDDHGTSLVLSSTDYESLDKAFDEAELIASGK